MKTTCPECNTKGKTDMSTHCPPLEQRRGPMLTLPDGSPNPVHPCNNGQADAMLSAVGRFMASGNGGRVHGPFVGKEGKA